MKSCRSLWSMAFLGGMLGVTVAGAAEAPSPMADLVARMPAESIAAIMVNYTDSVTCLLPSASASHSAWA